MIYNDLMRKYMIYHYYLYNTSIIKQTYYLYLYIIYTRQQSPYSLNQEYGLYHSIWKSFFT